MHLFDTKDWTYSKKSDVLKYDYENYDDEESVGEKSYCKKYKGKIRMFRRSIFNYD